MAFSDAKRTESVAHKYIFRVAAIEGSTVRVLWEGDSMGDGEKQAENFAIEARKRGSQETVVMDCFRLEVEKLWVQRAFSSRPPSILPPVRHPGKKGRPRILYMPLEFSTWAGGGASWSYAASLAYADALRAAGCDVTVVNTPCAPYHRKIIREQRFDQVWLHLHPKHLDDFAFRQWISDIAPVRLMLCGETVNYGQDEIDAEPWFGSHTQSWKRWAPHVTHAAFVDPSDVASSTVKRSMWWQQAAPARFVLPVNQRPRRDVAVFVGTLYPPRDRWAWELAGLVEKAECPESDAFRWIFEHSHEWIQRVFDRAGAEFNPPWAPLALKVYNRLQSGLRRHAFQNFLGALREGVAVVSLPSMIQTYSGRVIEGMASGRPVITQRIHGQAPIFEDGAEILHYETAEELRDQIEMLKSHPILANGIASAARTALIEKHTVEKRTAELLAFTEGSHG